MKKEKARLTYLLLPLFLICIFSGISCSNSDSDSGSVNPTPTPSAVYQFRAPHPVEGPIIEALKAKGVQIINSDKGSPSEDHGIILHAENITPEELSKSALIKDYIHFNKGVLILGATAEHKQAMKKFIGLSYGQDFTFGYFVLPVEGTNGREYTILEHPRFLEIKTSDMVSYSDEGDVTAIIDQETHDENQALAKAELEEKTGPIMFANAIIELVIKNEARKTKSDPTPDKYLKYRIWHIPDPNSTLKSTQVVWYLDSAWWGDYPNPRVYYPAPSPMKGWQKGAYSHVSDVQLYLNNDPNIATGPYQWLGIDHQGAMQPVNGSDHSVDGSDTITMPINGKKYEVLYTKNWKIPGWGWTQMSYVFSWVPDASKIQDLVYYKGLPENGITEKHYSAGTDFTVGFDKEGAHADFTVRKDYEVDIPSWEVEGQTDITKKAFSWLWYSNDPHWDENSIQGTNSLNTGLFQPAASAVVQTSKVIDYSIPFTLKYGVTMLTMACYDNVLSPHHHYRKDVNPDPIAQVIDIDFASVLYAIVSKVSVSPETVVGGNTTSGTVTLDEVVTTDTVVTLSSNNTNIATVPASITVPAGQGMQTFTITTKPVTANATVTITATLHGDTTGSFTVTAQ